MSVYPRNMSTFLNRMTNYNKNNVKMTVLGTPTANDGDVIQVDLPTNSIVDLSSLAWSFQVVYTGAAGTAASGGTDGQVTFPLNAESIISRPMDSHTGLGQCEFLVGETPRTPRHQNVAAQRATAQLSKPARAERARSRLPDTLLRPL